MSTHSSRVANRLRMRQVMLLLAIGECRTLRGAALELGMSQPAATKMLQELECALGHALFEREKRGLVLTASGDLTMSTFREMRRSLSTLEERLKGLTLMQRPASLLLGVTEPELPWLVSHALGELRRQQPDTSILCRTHGHAQLLGALREGSIDAALGWSLSAGVEPTPDLRFDALGPVQFSVLTRLGHALAHGGSGQRHVHRATQLGAWTWVVPSQECPSHILLETCLRDNRLRLPANRVEMATLSDALRMAASSDVLVIWPSHVLGEIDTMGQWACTPLVERAAVQWGVWSVASTACKPLMSELLWHLARAQQLTDALRQNPQPLAVDCEPPVDHEQENQTMAEFSEWVGHCSGGALAIT